jgi:integrase
MSKVLHETPLTTRSAREKLPAGLYWRSLDIGAHLGYRKGKRGGKWLVRIHIPVQKTYRRLGIGIADDLIDEGTLSFNAASSIARKIVSRLNAHIKADENGEPITVRSAVMPYIAMRDARDSEREGRILRSDASHKLTRHVLSKPDFADIRLDELTDEDLLGWQNDLPSHHNRVGKQRIVTDLKSALNAAYRNNRKRLPKDLPETIKYGLAMQPTDTVDLADVRQSQILNDHIVRRVVAAAFEVDDSCDFGRLILTLAATGARFSQLKRMKVGDVQLAQQRLFVPNSRKGRGRSNGYTPVRVGSDVIESLTAIVEDRMPDEMLFCRWRHHQVGHRQWARESRGAWTTPSEILRPWKLACERVGITGVVPYALRHSSIVRGIRKNLPVRLVAAIHDTSVVMIEKHYSRWIADGLEEIAAQAIVPLLEIAT